MRPNENFGMVQFCAEGLHLVGNGRRAVPPSFKRYGGRTLQDRAANVLPCFEPCRNYHAKDPRIN